VRKTEGIYLPPGTRCVVDVDFLSDGEKRTGAATQITCGSLLLVPRANLKLVGFEEHHMDEGWTYRVRLERGESHEEPPVARVLVDTIGPDPGAVLDGQDSLLYHVEIDLPRDSVQRQGEPLMLPIPPR
jgi:hypothetical protein